MRHVAVALLAIAAVASCDRRPISAYAALPREGSPVPAFRLPLVGGGAVASDTLRGAPTLLVLWSTTCGQSRRALRAVDQIRADYAARGARVLILADDADPARVRAVFDSVGARTPVAYASGRLDDLFDRSAGAPERAAERVAFALPSFLVLDPTGRVAVRAAGVEVGPVRLERLRVRLDSLLATPAPAGRARAG